MIQQKIKKQNDLLIPIILVLAVIPFVLYLKKYDSGLGNYNWYSSNGEVSDFYAYYRSKIFVMFSLISGIVLLFWFGLYKEKKRSLKVFYGLVVFLLGVTISTLLSVNLEFSVKGTYYNFETVFVLYGYVIMCLYAYQMIRDKADMQSILKAMTFMALVVIVWGGLEIFGVSLIEWEWFQSLIISEENSDAIGKIMNIFPNTVVATLFNPDYSGEYIAMILPVFFSLIFVQGKKGMRLLYVCISAALVILLWFTRYRGGMISLGATALIVLPIFVKRMRKIWIILISCIAVFFVCDVALNIGVLSQIKDKQQTYTMESVYTQEDGIYLESIENTSVAIAIEDNRLKIRDEKGNDITGQYDEHSQSINRKGFENVTIQLFSDKNMMELLMQFDNTNWTFTYTEDNGYTYVNDARKADVILTPQTFGNSQYEYLGSGRFYIWSRTIPLLTDYIVIGSGPNTFVTVFPQNDYVGKYHTYLETAIIIDKAHNNYLMMWVQYGFFALLGYLIFYVIYFIKNYKFFYQNNWKSYHSVIGFGFFAGTIVYMINSFFIDSSIFVSPVFWVMLGISMAELCIADGDEAFYRINKNK